MNRKFIFLTFLVIFPPFVLFAQYFSTPPLIAHYLQDAPVIESRAAVMIDMATGTLLYSKNPSMGIPPASLTKIMTMHLVLKEIDAGRISLDDVVTITHESWAQSQPRGSSLMFLAPGQIVTLREIMLGMAVPSGNDAAVAAALHIAPSVSEFVNMMNIEARRMGLTFTRFSDTSGVSRRNNTTAEEYAYFASQYITLHPYTLEDFHSVTVFSYPLAANVAPQYQSRPGTITQTNRNNLLYNFPGVDGLKTGYIPASGNNLALTAERDNTRIVLVLLGASSTQVRDVDCTNLLGWAFENFKTVRPRVPVIENARLWKGSEDIVQLNIAASLDFTSPVNRSYNLYYDTVFFEPLIAPLPEGFHAGDLIISDDFGEVNRAPLITASAYERGNFFKRLWHSIVLLFRK